MCAALVRVLLSLEADRQKLDALRLLLERRDKFGVAEEYLICPARTECLDQRPDDLVRIADAHGLGNAGVVRRDRPLTLGIMLLRLFADRDDRGVPALHLGGGQLEHVRVVAACQTAVARDDDVQAVLYLTASGVDRVAVARDRGQTRNSLIHGVEVRAHAQGALLCAAHLRGRDQLHRLCDLHGGLHRFDTAFDVLHVSGCHCSVPPCCF